MEWPYLILAFLGALSGLSAAYLGVGGSVLITPLLPLLAGLSPLESVQLSLTLIFLMSAANSLGFILQKLVLWPWVFPIAAAGLVFSFGAGLFVSRLSPGQIRFLLWLFLGALLALPLMLQKSKLLRKALLRQPAGVLAFGSLMGLCSGLTGLGGGMIVSPYLHEVSAAAPPEQKAAPEAFKAIPARNISAVVCASMFFVSLFAGAGHISAERVFGAPADVTGKREAPQKGGQSLAPAKKAASGGNFLLGSSPRWRFCLFLLLGASAAGLLIGYAANARCQSARRRRLILRSVIALMFLKVSFEFF